MHWLFLASAEVWGGQGLDLEKAGAGRGERRPFLGTSGWGVGLGPQLCHTDSSISSQPKAAFGLRGDLNLSRPFGAVLPYLGEGEKHPLPCGSAAAALKHALNSAQAEPAFLVYRKLGLLCEFHNLKMHIIINVILLLKLIISPKKKGKQNC